jgi:hypothetical protein
MTSEDPSLAAEQMQADIAITRQRVASEVDAIADKFTSAHVKRQLASSAQRWGNVALQLAKQNPIPTALLGIGLVVLFWRARTRD